MVIFVVSHSFQVDAMCVLPCGIHLPLHCHHLKHTIWDKEKLPLIPTGTMDYLIDMLVFVSGVKVDKIEDRGEFAFMLCMVTKCVLTISPVGRCGQIHGHMIQLAHREERGIHIWKTPSTI